MKHYIMRLKGELKVSGYRSRIKEKKRKKIFEESVARVARHTDGKESD